MRVDGVPYRTVWMEGETVKLIDQRLLPHRFAILSLTTYEETAEAIRDMAVRGAGAIGVAAGYAMAQAALAARGSAVDAALARAAARVRATRPTAQNLFYAVARVLADVGRVADPSAKPARAVETAQAIADEDAWAGEQIGRVGQRLFGSSTTLLTHCNAGWLAFADWGTALAPAYQAHRDGKRVHVYASETRPRSQGAKLTAWELQREGIPCTLIPDTAVGYLMRREPIDLVIVGADRIAANGDVANKIGTYAVAILARTHGIPFYVAAPITTIDLGCPTGANIPIEERADDEISWVTGVTPEGHPQRVRVSPEGVAVRNWAFDITPASYLTGFLTDRGLVTPDAASIRRLVEAPAAAASA